MNSVAKNRDKRMCDMSVTYRMPVLRCENVGMCWNE